MSSPAYLRAARHLVRRVGLRAVTLGTSLASVASAQRAADSVVRRDIAPGVTHLRIVDAKTPLVTNVVRVDLRRAAVELRLLRAKNQLVAREQVGDMVRREEASGATVLAAVNADFFDVKTGESENNQILAGEWWKGLKVTDSPYDTYDNVHTQFGVDAAGRPLMDRFLFDGRAIAHGIATPIVSLNFNPSGKPEGTALFTPRFGPATPRDTTRATVEVVLDSAGRRGDTLLYVRRGAVSATSGSSIPARGAVLAAYGPGERAAEVRRILDGDTVRLVLATLPRPRRGIAPRILVGGWPRILRNGVNVAPDAAVLEGTISRNAEVKHPRTAVGFSRDSSVLFLVVVDGRTARSAGVTLSDLAAMMRRLGAWDAMNLDGGGSTTMVIGGDVVNAPSDAAGEREVGSAIAVVRKR